MGYYKLADYYGRMFHLLIINDVSDEGKEIHNEKK